MTQKTKKMFLFALFFFWILTLITCAGYVVFGPNIAFLWAIKYSLSNWQGSLIYMIIVAILNFASLSYIALTGYRRGQALNNKKPNPHRLSNLKFFYIVFALFPLFVFIHSGRTIFDGVKEISGKCEAEFSNSRTLISYYVHVNSPEGNKVRAGLNRDQFNEISSLSETSDRWTGDKGSCYMENIHVQYTGSFYPHFVVGWKEIK